MGMIANYHAYLAVGIILVLLGVLSWSERLPYNYVAGIRIPSVMEDKSSWRAGHRASGPAMVALVAGNIQLMFDNLTTAIVQVRAGKVRALAVTSADRSPQLPELPALRETAPELAAYDVSTWFGMFLPARTPAPALQALNEEMRVLIESPAAQERFTQMGGTGAWSTPDGFAAFVNAEIGKWRTVIRREGLQMDVG